MAVYLLNALFSQRIERKYTQLAGAIMFADGWWGVYAVHNTPALVTFFAVSTVGITLWQFSMGNTYPATTRPGCARWVPAGPTAWATSAPGRRPAQQSGLYRSRAAGLDLADYHTGRASPRLHGRDLRETPAPPHARRAGPVDAEPPGLSAGI